MPARKGERPHNYTHGLSKTPFFKKWQNAKRRCLHKTSSRYRAYGDRGIKLLWITFPQFKEEMYASYLDHVKIHGIKNTTLDRIDNNGDYSKENCKWSTWAEQMSNLQKSHIIEFQGKKQTMAQWAREMNLPVKALEHRIYRGWEIEKALLTPLRSKV